MTMDFWKKECGMFINKGDEFYIDESKDRIVGGNQTIRLINNGIWIEITVETFFEHFNFEECK